MMSTPIERATSAWLEWARRVGMTTMREVMTLLLLVSPRAGARMRRGSASNGDPIDRRHADGGPGNQRAQRSRRGAGCKQDREDHQAHLPSGICISRARLWYDGTPQPSLEGQ